MRTCISTIPRYLYYVSYLSARAKKQNRTGAIGHCPDSERSERTKPNKNILFWPEDAADAPHEPVRFSQRGQLLSVLPVPGARAVDSEKILFSYK
jgi:hypothetical protein